MTVDTSRYYADHDAPICPLVIKEHFDTLSDKEKAYAHHIGYASWLGARIILEQTTPQSSDIFDLIRATFSASKDQPEKLADLAALRSAAGVSEEDFTSVLEYAAQFLSNLANYKSFGDIKFIPRVGAETFRKVVAAAPRADEALPLFDKYAEEIYSVTPTARTLLGYLDDGHVTNYYSGPVTQADIKAVQKYVEANGPDPLNTRLFKGADGVLELRVASADTKPVEEVKVDDSRKMKIVYGDYSAVLAKIADSMAKAIPYAANDHQRKMLEHYVTHFRNGDVEAHKDSQREWIKDVGPVVESDIGFIETYRDPSGVRGEWEGFVAVVNKEMTKKFGKLVDSAPVFIPKLPWSKDFEKDEFKKPDFTSLEVLSFATGGVPAGINIPNYDDIRQNEGFKNVSLGNVLSAKAPNEKITFLSDADAALFEKYRAPAFEVQVGIHELLGHGSGKLLQVFADGSANFDRNAPPTNPLTGKPVEHWYGPGETWGSVFGTISSSYEECRAETVAMYLSVNPDMLAIFGHTDSSSDVGTGDEIMYVAWLQMCRAGLLALEFYDPAAKKWGQAHMQARYAITRVLLDAGEGLVSIAPHGDGDLRVSLDKDKIRTVGIKAMGDFLTKLQVYKATADVNGGKALYDRVTSVPDDWLAFRDIVLAKRLPRKLLLQANTALEGDKVVLREYSPDLAGFIQSYLERAI